MRHMRIEIVDDLIGEFFLLHMYHVPRDLRIRSS